MYKYLLILTLFFLFSCSREDSVNQKAFYYWKTNYNFTQEDRQLAEKMQLDKLYIRFFDVKWNAQIKEAVPVGKLTISNTVIFPENYVPCVFITNDVILNTSKEELSNLANKIANQVNVIAKEISSLNKDTVNIGDNYYPELQIDCDWSIKSKEKFFFFIKKLKNITKGKEITLTLRLWQLKNKKEAGVPPVDRVMLMCYSTGNPKDYIIDNSLANYKEIEKYVKGQTYPLKLDIALPIYSWAILFRNKKFKTIIRDINFANVKKDTSLYEHLKDNRYVFKKDTVMLDSYMRYGDELRLESFNGQEMLKLINLLKKEDLRLSNSVVSFFAWDSTYIKNHGYEKINAYFNSFNNN